MEKVSKGQVWIISQNFYKKYLVNINFLNSRMSTCTIGELTILGVYLPSENSKKSFYDIELKQIENHLNAFQKIMAI